jgi:hypothetical protein
MSDTTSINVSISPDHDGYLGRECPKCELYFKIMPGTGLTDTDEMTCPYCQTTAGTDQFFTKEQVAYAQSIALQQAQHLVMGELKKTAQRMNFETAGPISIKVSMTIEEDEITIEHYQDKQLETELTCDNCGLSYKIYGIFASCPDCTAHNSQQILTTNLDVLCKQLENADDTGLQDILKNTVALFDAYGRTTTEHHTGTKISFQNLEGAEKNLQSHGHSLRAHLTREEWEFLNTAFQKRHVLTHNLGVIDEDYLQRAHDPDAILGRKVKITKNEVERTIDLLQRLGKTFTTPAQAPADQTAAVMKREAIKKNPYQLRHDALQLARLLFSKDEHGYASGYTDKREAQQELGLGNLEFQAALTDLADHQLVTIEHHRWLASTEHMPLALISDLGYQPAADDVLVAETLIKEDRYIPNAELETLTGLPKDRLNRSVRRLKDKGAIDLTTAMGSAPYVFISARATGNTIRYLRNTA